MGGSEHRGAKHRGGSEGSRAAAAQEPASLSKAVTSDTGQARAAEVSPILSSAVPQNA